jgi:hypothetical protein
MNALLARRMEETRTVRPIATTVSPTLALSPAVRELGAHIHARGLA